ncbi:cytochrome P450 6g1-like [Calliphora vicina]|uniref:cytochrome P450 6g1-like n=1 Tax=Calliphora vicina TaxID=7373 RepID=UPI00325BA109
MLLTIILIVLIGLLSILYILFKINFNYWLQYPQITSVKGKIFSGNFIDFLTFKTNFGYHLRTLYEDQKYCNEAVVGIYALYEPGLLIKEPEIIKSILIKDFDCFNSRTCRGDLSHDPLGALNLFFSSYTHWREMRLKLSPVFSTGKLKFMYPLVQKVGVRLEDCLQQKGNRFTLELKQLCGRYTTEVITTTLMGFTSKALENNQEYIYQEAVKLSAFNMKRAVDFLITFFAPKLNSLLRPRIFYQSTEQFMRSSIACVMEERERLVGSRNDLIDAFVKIKQEVKSKGEQVAQCMESLIAQACIFMSAGFDTSSTTIANALFEMAKDPQVQQKLRQEILQAFTQGQGEISYDSLNKMEYLQMVIDEVLRLYPVLPILDRRYCKAANRSLEFSLEPYYDYKLPDGMPVYISVFGLHYDPKYWPNPTKFDPERFSPANKKLLNPLTYLPFGDGPHNCIGSRLGLLQVKVGLVHLLKHYRVQVCAETVLKPKFEPMSIVLQTKGGIHVEFIKDMLCENLVNKLE